MITERGRKTPQTRKGKKMKAMNKIEEYVLEMVKAGKPVRGSAREVLVEMTLREEEGKGE